MALNLPPTDGTYLIAGLGNPGSKFEGTRHNAGFMVVDELARRHGLRLSKGQAHAEVARGEIEGVRVTLVKPLTYMNLSGKAVSQIANFYKIPPEHVLVIYDDTALPLGTIRIREKGSAGGHNGIASVIRLLGTQSFPRLRVGVDRPAESRHGQVGWVLGRFSKEEREVVQEVILTAADAVEAILRDGIERAMNRYNARDGGGAAPQAAKSEEAGQPPGSEATSAPVVAVPDAPKVNRWVAKLRGIYRGEKEA